jgi:hypothetical protein
MMRSNRIKDTIGERGCYPRELGDATQSCYLVESSEPRDFGWGKENLLQGQKPKEEWRGLLTVKTDSVNHATELIRQNMRIVTLEAQIAELSRSLTKQIRELIDQFQRLSYLESLVPSLSIKANFFEVRDALNRVQEFTTTIFSQQVAPTEREDCEDAGERYFEFNVNRCDSIDETLKKFNEWHSLVSQLPINVRGLFHLSFCE